ncbi:MAG: CHAP domain-containing protein [Acidisphaera sp.]|nr:CHAP domain-containing protein [Acidisphaera sp.]
MLVRYARAGGGISCVPFARAESGIGLKGNAETWWNEADGVYARGSAPEPGSVLSFRANYAMHLGHVAVVTHVIGNRQVEIDQANWAGPGAARGGVSRNISVVDVSQNNDWTAVRVALGHSGTYGSVYPTYGFIYDRPDGATTVASARQADINPPPRDLRPADERTPLAVVHPVLIPPTGYDEVAEAPEGGGGRAASGPLTLDAPDRSLR